MPGLSGEQGMSQRKLVALLTFPLLVITAFSCRSGRPAGNDGEGLQVATSILPQKYFVHRIAADRADVIVMVPSGASPATYEPSSEDLRMLSEADLYLTVGVPFERVWLDRFESINPSMKVVSTIEGLNRRSIDRWAPGKASHRGEDHHHAQGNPDPHVWLSPEMVKTQAENIAEALTELDPQNASVYESQLQAFVSDLETLQSEIDSILRPMRGSAFMVFHPSWGYFADEFGLRQLPIEIEGREPTPSELAGILDHADSAGIRAILVAPQFSTGTARTIAREIGAELVEADPLAEGWRENLLRVAERIADST
ncbi:cation ABC transporter substrate-binding protein [Candidatus Fermentibacteria bacterium]|nr:cation ABC transporter substrate-binding protein [Candidatus Fermentibacteria bacterium]